MDIGDSASTAVVIGWVAVLVGAVGVFIPVIPGLVVSWAGVLIWALVGNAGPGRWAVLGVATVIAIVGTVAKVALPGRGLKRAGVPNWTLLVGGVLGIVGFFVVPVVGLVLGFVLGVFLAEQVRLRDGRAAWRSTRQALKAAGLSMLIELAAAIGVGVTYAIGLLVT